MTPKSYKGYYALRWKILERDKFTCQYCGQKAPNVPLEVGHIKPIEEGGESTEENLITSCWACNRGKGALAVINKRVGKYAPFEGGSDYVPNAFRRDELLSALKDGPLTSLELSRKCNISRAYTRVLLSRNRQKGLVQKFGNKWSLT